MDELAHRSIADADGGELDVTHADRRPGLDSAEERQFRDLVRHLPSAVAMLDDELRYLAVSKKWLTDFELDGVGLEGRRHYDVFPDVPARLRDVYARALGGETFSADEERFDHDDGSVAWLSWDARPWFHADGSVGGIMIMTENVTARVERRMFEERESRLASLGYLAGGVAHEINSPLQVIALEAEVIRMELSAEAPSLAEIKKSIEAIEETAQRASSIIQAMKALARDGASDPATDVPVVMLLHDVDTLCRNRFRATDVELTITDRAPGAMVRGRAAELVQILLNLVNNGYAAARSAREHWVRLDVEATDREVAFRCTDSGPGVPDAMRARIMEPFFTTKPVGEGTGLGLSIAHSFAHRNEGRLELLPGTPTTFVLTLVRGGVADTRPGDGGPR